MRATPVFLDINGHPPDLDDGQAFELVMAVAEGTLDVDDIAGRLGPPGQAAPPSA